MKFLILNADYPSFLHWLYDQHPGLDQQSYEEQMRARMETLFGVADFYSSNLCKLGHEASTICFNNEFLQRSRAREHKAKTSPKYDWRFRLRRGIVPWLDRVCNDKWMYEILAAQIESYKPDVLLNQAIPWIDARFLSDIKPHTRLLVGQHAANLPPLLADDMNFDCYDLVISSFPPTVDFFRQRQIPAELNRLAFEPRVLDYLRPAQNSFDVTFVGNFHQVHSSRVSFLESVCYRIPQTRVWGESVERLSPDSPIRRCYVGQAWGREMYQILAESKMTLNHHGDIPPYANNLRLFEATGVGTLLITDWKENLPEMFEPGKEVVVYRSVDECVELIKYHLEHPVEREGIARAGQQRTLMDHTYYRRMQEFVDIVCKYLYMDGISS